MSVDLAIVFTPVGGGHRAAALAVAEAAAALGRSVELIDLFDLAPRFVGDAYKAAHLTGQRALPALYGDAYFASNRRDGPLEPVRRGADHVLFAALRRRMRALAPRAVVATHHLPLVVLGRARRRGQLAAPLVGVVTDYTAHAYWAEKGVDAWCVGCPLARHELILHGARPDRIVLTGIPVKHAFASAPAVRDPAPGEALRVLVTSGSIGVGPMRAIVRSFEGVPDVELAVVCGAAKGLVQRAWADAAAAKLSATIVGFEKDMAARVTAAHLVVGKAGGLTVSEALAAGRPMVLVGTVPGNELFNERLVLDAGAGVTAPPGGVGAACDALRRLGAVATMGGQARKLVPHHAGDRIVALASSLAQLGRAA